MTFMQQVRQRNMQEALVCLFTLQSVEKNIAIRYTNNGRDLVSNGNTFTAYPFTFVWPPSGGEDLPEIRVTCNGADDTLRAAVKSLPTEKREATMTLQLVLASDPDTVIKECSAQYYQAPGVSAESIELVAGYTDQLGEAGLKRKYDTMHYPGLHAQGAH